jgi:hypothetical protein
VSGLCTCGGEVVVRGGEFTVHRDPCVRLGRLQIVVRGAGVGCYVKLTARVFRWGKNVSERFGRGMRVDDYSPHAIIGSRASPRRPASRP